MQRKTCSQGAPWSIKHWHFSLYLFFFIVSFKIFFPYAIKFLLLCYAILCYAKSLQSCPTLCDPIDGSPPAPPSLGFSRQEHWSGLPFPSPMQESEKWKWSSSVVSDPRWPHGLQCSRLLHPWDFPGKSTGVGCHCLLIKLQLNSSGDQTMDLCYYICTIIVISSVADTSVD